MSQEAKKSRVRPLHRLQEDFAYYDALSRTRALTEMESRRFETVIAHLDNKPGRTNARGRGWSWTSTDDATLLAERAAGRVFSQIGAIVGRSKASCISRYHYLMAEKAMAA